MVSLILVLTIISAFLLSLVIIYALIHFRENFKSSSSYENQRLTYSTQPSIDIIPKKLVYPLNFSNHYHSSNINLNKKKSNQLRSHSLANNVFITKCSNRRRSSIIDSKQIAQIEFSLPPTTEKIRRRSVAICNNINESKQTTIDSIIKTIKSSHHILPCLASFSLVYYKSSQIKIYFHSLTSLPSAIQLQQLTIQVKLIPDGKVKCFSIKNILHNENIFAQDNNEHLIQFSNIPLTKLHVKAILMKFYGKDQTKKTIQLGQIGKIYFNQINNVENEQPINFIHEIEIIRTSSMEVLVLLEQNNDHYLTVEIQRIKGLKIDQKNSTATCYFRVILLDRHRPLSTHQTKSYRLNASTFSLNESFNINILAFNSSNRDRIMIMVDLYSNAKNMNEHRCIARIKLASPYFCSGTGTIHWQQFKQRQSFSMWHKLIKQ
ncbi:unnamed protein product [Rotaria sp. Silwood2]|nr:unnamed protein product [Rotaria sp. Silwood2]CAF2667153.1 unnamed protein product [Rotaria sp. Silwood2]CAF4001449.1 unnamed protein product [Rotaria sp. Silwood2]CAF4144222.1 unnamed protein product [Rotaria sp. Silwood2]